jgi:hypothetical protein
MRKIVLSILTMLLVQVSFGQLTGSYTIPGAPYATIASAISALNTQGAGIGGVTFNVTAGYTETFASPTAGLITTTTGSAANPIVFQKSGAGANPLITAGTPGTGTMDYVFCILGTDYITFDGINIQENAANTTTTQQMEWGYAVLKASATDGSQNVTIKNCSISLNKSNTATYAIYSNNHTNLSTTQLTVTAASGGNSNNKFFGLTMSNVYHGIYLYGFADGTVPYLYYDQGNEIGRGQHPYQLWRRNSHLLRYLFPVPEQPEDRQHQFPGNDHQHHRGMLRHIYEHDGQFEPRYLQQYRHADLQRHGRLLRDVFTCRGQRNIQYYQYLQ